jgi:hypothetical protein
MLLSVCRALMDLSSVRLEEFTGFDLLAFSQLLEESRNRLA